MGELLPFQGPAVEWLAARPSGILAMPQGMGKTVIAIVAAARVAQRLDVVCPASVASNWRAEIERWAPELVSYVHTYDDVRLKKVLDVQGGVLIADEAHRLKDPQAKRTRAFANLRKTASRVWFLSGTPMPNRPIELWPMLRMCDALPPEVRGFHEYGLRYASAYKDEWGRWNYDGKSNLDELSRHLAPVMYRADKGLLELPPKLWSMISLDGDLVEAGELELTELPIDRKVLDITKASEIRKMCALAKLPSAVKYVRDALESDPNKIVVFAHHAEVIATLQRELARYNPAVITGLTAPKRRGPLVQKFQTDPSCQLFIGNIAAAGEGITLTASSRVIFAEPPWSWAELDQASDRVHRIGQTEPVSVEVLALRGSLDERMLRRCLEKLRTMERVVTTTAVSTESHTTQEDAPMSKLTDTLVATIAEELRKIVPSDSPNAHARLEVSVGPEGTAFNLNISSYPSAIGALTPVATPAEEPKTDKPAKPAKAAKPAEEPKADKPAEGDPSKAKKITRDDVRAKIVKLAMEKGRPSATGIIKGVGAEKVDDIKEEDFAAVMEAVDELLSK